jgi:mono/diheme cytochrome c family protein
MNEPTADTDSGTDGLWRWLVGGLVAGGLMLGLLIAAYAIGYHEGHHSGAAASAPTTSSTPTVPTTSTTPPPTTEPVVATPALIARGKSLFNADGCAGCHALTSTAGAGPGFKGLAGSSVTLANGQTITADAAYLEQSIVNPDAQIVKGYRSGLMPAAIASSNLAGKPADVRALVAFITSQQ